ncbi:MAG: alpha/beta hydrolase [Roseovarius sp.]
MSLWLILAAWVAAAVWPFTVEALRPRMNAARRSTAPGDFAKLSKGLTHYRWLGAEDGPVAVCVHGLTTPSFVWGPVAEVLGRMGYRVLVYDLYGRGYSDRPKGAQDSDFFCAQLEELLADQGVEGRFALFGYSMGGAISTAFAARHPERVQQLVLLAPAGLGHDLGPIAEMAVKYDLFGRWMTYAFYPKSLRRATESERGAPSAIPNVVDLQIAETRLKGFTPAVLASLRGMLDKALEEEHRAIAAEGLPVLAIWGEDDEVIPLSCKEQLAEWNPEARQEVVPGAGHAVTYSHVEALAEIFERKLPGAKQV